MRGFWEVRKESDSGHGCYMLGNEALARAEKGFMARNQGREGRHKRLIGGVTRRDHFGKGFMGTIEGLDGPEQALRHH